MKTLTCFTLSLFLIAAGIQAAERFDELVRGDFFAGFAGNQAALDRGMKLCEEALAKDPANAEALVWHGSGTLFLSGQSFKKGDYAAGGQLWGKGLQEMDSAVSLAPRSVAVLIPRGATLLVSSAAVPPEQGRPLLEKGVKDYREVREIQKPYFEKLSGHARGELLFGLADGYNRLDQKPEAREAFEALLALGKESGHQDQAQKWLAGEPYGKTQLSCTGCHVAK